MTVENAVSAFLLSRLQYGARRSLTKWLEINPTKLSGIKRCGTVSHVRNIETDEVSTALIHHTGVITLNRNDKFNALSLKMILKMESQLKRWSKNPEMSLIILKGANSGVFCAGGDAVYVSEASKRGNCHLFKDHYRLMYTLGTFKIPRIVLMGGITLGSGVGLAVNGTYRVATEKTLLSVPETALGFFVDWGGANFMPALPHRLGWYLGLTGARLKSRDVYRAGMATHFVDSEKIPQLEEELMSLRKPLCEDIEDVLTNFHKQSCVDINEPFLLEPYLDTINKVFDGQTMEEIFCKLEEDGSDWCKTQLNLLKQLCPTSLKVTLRHFQLGMRSSLAETLTRDYVLSVKCTQDYNFYEGVRSVLVEKDNKPVWKPATIREVSDEKLVWYFTPLPDDEALHLKN